MKARFIAPIILFFLGFSINAQYKKMPFDANHFWVGYFTNSHHTSGVAYYYTSSGFKDSAVNSIIYKYFPGYNSYDAFLRDDTLLKRVTILDELNHEHILYNFNKTVGDTAMLSKKVWYVAPPNIYTSTYTLTAFDSVILSDGQYHKRFTYSNGNSYKIIEGVGGPADLVMPYEPLLGIINTTLVCVGTYSPASTIYHKDGIGHSCSLDIDVNVKENNGIKSSFSIFPNPTSETLNFEYTENPESIIIQNITGNTINEIKHPENTINVNYLPNGIYFI